MELEVIESDLLSLRKLYGLLQSMGNGSQSASSQYLDEKAQIFLKNLLDGATERVFEVQSKLLAAQLGVFDTTPAPQRNKLDGMPIPKPPLSLNVPKTFCGVAQSSAKAPNSNPPTPQENERTPIKPKTQVIVSQKSMFGSSAPESENRKRHCSVCQQSQVKQIKSTEERSHNIQNPNMGTVNIQHQQPNQCNRLSWGTGPVKGLDLDKQVTVPISSIGTQWQKVIHKIQSKPGGAGPLAYPSIIPRSGVAKSGAMFDLGGEIEKKPDETSYRSEEVANAIRQVELRISSLQLAAELVGASEKSAALHRSFEMMANSIPGMDSVSPMMQKQQDLGPWSELGQARKFVVCRNDSLGKQVSQRVWESKKLSRLPQVISQKQKTDSVGNDFRSQMASHNTSKPMETELPNQAVSQTSKLLPPPPNNGPLSRLVSEKVAKSISTALLNDIPGNVGKPVPNGHGKPSWMTVQVNGRNVKAIEEKIESLNRLPKQNDRTSSHTLQCAQGLSIPPSQTNMANVASVLPSTMPTQLDKENRNQNLMPQKEIIRKVGTSQPSKWAPSLWSMELTNRRTQVENASYKLSGLQSRKTPRREKGLPQRAITRPKRRSQHMVSPTLYGSLMEQESSKWVARQKKISPYEQELEDTSSSSSWTSQQASTSGSYSEEFSLPSHTRGKHDMGPTSTSESEGYSSGQTGYSFVGPTSSSESEVHPLPSRYRPHHMGSTSGSESEGYSSQDRVRSRHHMDLSSRVADSTSTSASCSKDSRSGNRVKPKKQIGRLRRLKDKLALVFHHHHHHHHHNDDGNHRGQKAKVRRGTSLWKYAGKIFHGTRKDEAYGERAAEKITKSVVCKVPDKNQHGHFHTLVKGLLGHVQSSKKTKPLKGGIKRMGGNQHGGKKAAKKLQWWQMFRHQKAVKLSSIPCVKKLGLGNKKSRLRSLRKMK